MLRFELVTFFSQAQKFHHWPLFLHYTPPIFHTRTCKHTLRYSIRYVGVRVCVYIYTQTQHRSHNCTPCAVFEGYSPKSHMECIMLYVEYKDKSQMCLLMKHCSALGCVVHSYEVH